MLVPNVFPTSSAPYRLAIVGEAPGTQESLVGQPFAGGSGRLLDSILSSCGVARQHCLVGNICQFQPPGNDIQPWLGDSGRTHSPRVVEGLRKLMEDLQQFQPNLCLLLGGVPLRFARGLEEKRMKRTVKYVPPSISSWRGSLFVSETDGPFKGFKCLATFHPAFVLRVYKTLSIFRFDVAKAKVEAETKQLVVPVRNITICKSADEMLYWLNLLLEYKWTVAFDLEGYPWNMTCFSFATDAQTCFVCDLTTLSETDELRVIQALSKVMRDPLIGKIMQNALYDTFVLSTYQIYVASLIDDTMLKAWSAHSELEKGLGFLASIYTREPFWKDKREHEDKQERLIYNGRDSCVTYELNQKIGLKGKPLDQYRFNINLLSPVLYMQCRGLRWNKDLCSDAIKQYKEKRTLLQADLNSIVGAPLNVESPKQMLEFLYNKLKLPQQFKEDVHGDDRPTADALACLKLIRLTQHPALTLVLKIRNLNSLLETLAISTDSDGRIRCGYNVVGTTTGRLACYESPTGSGMNLQTVTKKLRYLVEADPDHFMFQCDLAGADGWTVAAECKMVGDPTMLDDYYFGLKPARLIALAYQGVSINMMTRQELKHESKKIDSDSWLYFASKRVQHATNYGTTPRTIVDQVLKDSYKLSGEPIYIDEQTAKKLQQFYLARYKGVPAQQQFIINQVKTRGYIDCASGQRRTFFGRRDDHATHKEAFAQHPQANTTWATNMALWKLWSDQANRLIDNNLVIEPLHQVHDALLGQFPVDYLSFARHQIKEYFSTPITIAGTTLTIPYEGSYGSSWGDRPSEHNLLPL